MENNNLYHFGKKGMKWGIRRGKKSTSGSKKSKKNKVKKGIEEKGKRTVKSVLKKIGTNTLVALEAAFTVLG